MIVDCAAYTKGRRREGELTLEDAPQVAKEPDTFVWIGVLEPNDEEFDEVRRAFGLHELAVEDALEASQRPNMELYDDSAFIVLKTASYDDDSETISIGEVMLFLGDDYVVAVRHGGKSLRPVRSRLEERDDLLAQGPFAVLYVIADALVDDYALVAGEVDIDIQQVEAEVFDPGTRASVERIYALKREVLDFARASRPLETPLDLLARGRVAHCPGELREYFGDVHDHLARVIQQEEAFRDLLTSVLEANLTQVGVQQNDDMRKISAWVAIAAVPTLVAGIYGMNFERMPALDEPWGYPAVLVVMASACLFLYRKFKQSGWL